MNIRTALPIAFDRFLTRPSTDDLRLTIAITLASIATGLGIAAIGHLWFW